MKEVVKKIVSILLFRRIVWTGAAGGGLYITFDDGPDRDNNAEILRVLKGEQCAATFFLLGSAAEMYPDIVRDIHSHGHVVSNHGMTHDRRSAQNIVSFVKGVLGCHKLLQEITGDKALRKLFRPPFGEIRAADAIILILCGFRIVMWSKDSNDSFIADEDGLVSYLEDMAVVGGDILLFHEDSKMTTKVLPKIIPLLRRKNGQFSIF